MKQLIRLKEAELYKISSTQTSNGDYIKSQTLVKKYQVIVQSLTDNISATIYGANINKMVRISSVNKELENFLFTKWNNTSDNISKYEIKFEDNFYKIESLTSKYIDCQRQSDVIIHSI